MLELFGLEITKKAQYKGKMKEDFIRKLNVKLEDYRKGKQNLERKIIENEQWYRSQHWDLVRGNNTDTTIPEPVTAFLFNLLWNKKADATDNYPEPNMLPRQRDDEKEAEKLSHIVPLVLDKTYFRTTYADGWWYKLKHGCVPYGVFWNDDLENGLGDIDIKRLDLLNIYWKPKIKDIQETPVLFILTLMDDEDIKSTWPHTNGRLSENKVLDVKSYFNDDNIDTTGMSIVVDAYYKVKVGKKTIVHLAKYVDEIPLDSTEDYPELAETGLYEHGMYPIVFDVLFPLEDTPVGFGLIDIAKNPQMYIDKLDQIISKNALVSGKQRHFVKQNGTVNEEEFADLSKDIVHVNGDIENNIKSFQADPLHPFIINHRNNKIAELKEIGGNRDFNQGGSNGGVTAYGAIVALQEAGNKLSRDMISDYYAGPYYKKINMVVELIRQFYDDDRQFRILGKDNKPDYIAYNNQGIKPIPLPPAYEGAELEEGYEQEYRKPVFDINIKPEKANPFNRAAMNQLAMDMFGKGMFNPAKSMEALTALEMMFFEGKDKLIQLVQDNGQVQEQMTQMQQTILQMARVIQHLTGRDVTQSNDAVTSSNIADESQRRILVNG